MWEIVRGNWNIGMLGRTTVKSLEMRAPQDRSNFNSSTRKGKPGVHSIFSCLPLREPKSRNWMAIQQGKAAWTFSPR